MQKESLLTLLKREIPISQHMGINLLRIDELEVELELPLRPNSNHKGTLFGGSIYSGCALASYALFLNSIREVGLNTNNIVIGEGKIRYLRPLTKDSFIRAQWSSKCEKDLFFEKLSLKGKARIELMATIHEDEQLACEFKGKFVAFEK